MSKNKYNAEKENSIFAKKLRLLFDESKKTQQDLINHIAAAVGKAPTRQAVSMWLHGNSPDIKTVPIIADFFGVSTDFLLTDTNIRTADTDLKAVCEYTGLSDRAVSLLKNGYPDYVKTVNALFDDAENEFFSLLGYQDCSPEPSVLEALFRYLCVSREKQASSWYIAQNGNIINSMSTDQEYIRSNIEDISSSARLKDISINEIAEKILFDDVCAAIKRLKDYIELDVFEPTDETSEIIKKSSDDNYPF